jgi:hypothetical protein
MNRSSETDRDRQELRAKRQELHGKRRRLHERLAEVCEDFVLEHLTKEHKQKALVRELGYLLDYYRDPDSWQGVE